MPELFAIRNMWKRIGECFKIHENDEGYFEIITKGEVWRTYEGAHGTIWIRWEPYARKGHFTAFCDTDAVIKFVPHKWESV